MSFFQKIIATIVCVTVLTNTTFSVGADSDKETINPFVTVGNIIFTNDDMFVYMGMDDQVRILTNGLSEDLLQSIKSLEQTVRKYGIQNMLDSEPFSSNKHERLHKIISRIGYGLTTIRWNNEEQKKVSEEVKSRLLYLLDQMVENSILSAVFFKGFLLIKGQHVQQDDQEAMKLFEKAMELDATSTLERLIQSLSAYLLAEMYYKKYLDNHNKKSGSQYMDRAIDLLHESTSISVVNDPSYNFRYSEYALAVIYSQIDREQEAVDMLFDATKKDLNALTVLEKIYPIDREVKELSMEVIESNTKAANFYIKLGKYYKDKGDFAESIIVLERFFKTRYIEEKYFENVIWIVDSHIKYARVLGKNKSAELIQSAYAWIHVYERMNKVMGIELKGKQLKNFLEIKSIKSIMSPEDIERAQEYEDYIVSHIKLLKIPDKYKELLVYGYPFQKSSIDKHFVSCSTHFDKDKPTLH